MLKELQDVIDLIAECPEDVQRKAARDLSVRLQEHEDWVSLGCPDARAWTEIRMQRMADRAASTRKPKFVELWEKHSGKPAE